MTEPFVKQDAGQITERTGKVVIGSVKGDIHDIGKDMVIFMLDVNGFEVQDLGVNVPPEEFVAAIRQTRPQIVGMSALLTTVFDSFKNTVAAIKAAGMRDEVKIMIGGGTVTDDVRKYSGADAYGKDAAEAVKVARERETNIITMSDMERMGIDKTAEMALEMAWDGVDMVYMSFDIDSIDCGFVPGTGWPERQITERNL